MATHTKEIWKNPYGGSASKIVAACMGVGCMGMGKPHMLMPRHANPRPSAHPHDHEPSTPHAVPLCTLFNVLPHQYLKHARPTMFSAGSGPHTWPS
eukprot:363257-Chlamydomonas_euryale.AAC.16